MVSFSAILVACIVAVGTLAAPAPPANEPGSGFANGYFFLFTKESTGNVTFANGAKGQFDVRFSDAGRFTAGKGYNPGSARDITYNSTINEKGDVNLGILGRTTNPAVEYRIVDDYNSDLAANATLRGNLTSDGSLYLIYENKRVNATAKPTPDELRRYWSVRTEKRTSGTVTTANHFKAWAKLGLDLGKFDFQIVATEGYGKDDGSAHVDVLSPPENKTTPA